jgi:hypothetical protein
MSRPDVDWAFLPAMKKVLSPCRGSADRAAVATCPRRSAHLQVNTLNDPARSASHGGHSIERITQSVIHTPSGRQAAHLIEHSKRTNGDAPSCSPAPTRRGQVARTSWDTFQGRRPSRQTRPGPAKSAGRIPLRHDADPGGDGLSPRAGSTWTAWRLSKLRASDVAEALCAPHRGAQRGGRKRRRNSFCDGSERGTMARPDCGRRRSRPRCMA